MKLAALILALTLSLAQLAWADEAKPDTGATQYTVTLTREELNLDYAILQSVTRPSPMPIDALLLKIQGQIAEQEKAIAAANAKSHAEAVQKDEKQ